MNVDRDLLSILKNGSLQGYRADPHSTVCSRMCGTPVLSMGVVRNWTLEHVKQRLVKGAHALVSEGYRQPRLPEEVVGVISGCMKVLSSGFIVP